MQAPTSFGCDVTDSRSTATRITECRWLHMPYVLVDAIVRENPLALIGSGRRRVDDEIRVELTAHMPGTGLAVAAEAAITVGAAEEHPGPIPSVRVPMEWRATHGHQFFPEMHAYFEAFPTTPTDTELAIVGEYTPPLGAVGVVVDHAVMHRVASETVAELLEAIATEIKRRRRTHGFDEERGPDG